MRRTSLLHHPVVQISSFYVGIKGRIKTLDVSSSLKIGSIPQICMFDLFHNLKCLMTHQKRAKRKLKKHKQAPTNESPSHVL